MKMKRLIGWSSIHAPYVLISLVAVQMPVMGQLSGADTATVVNQKIRSAWKVNNITPTGTVDDAQYLRRVYLDIVGTIPTAEAVREFLQDTSSNKRQRVVSSLLKDPKYAQNWTNYWDSVLMGRTYRAQTLDKVAWKQWLNKQFANNVPFNKFVYDLISAEGINSTGGNVSKAAGLNRRPDQMAIRSSEDLKTNSIEDGAITPQGRVNGAVNWILKYQATPADLAGNASKIFLGVQIQCAQCHDHKTEKWKQDDFRKFTACFMNARPRQVGEYEKGSIRRVDLEDANRQFAGAGKKAMGRNEYLNQPPMALDGTDFSNAANRRKGLAAWMTTPENPWFAQAIVNRMWNHFLGRGFVEPVDDFRPGNPVVMPEVLNVLTKDFVAHDFDVKYLIRLITSTEAYQRTSLAGAKADPENKYYSRFRLKPIGPEQTLDSLILSTGVGTLLEKISGGNLEALKFSILRQLTFLFDVDEEFEQKDFEGTIPQALLLLNSNLTNRTTQPIPGSALAHILNDAVSDNQVIEELYLRTLSRKPTISETKKWLEFVNAPRDVVVTAPSPQPEISKREERKMFDRKQIAQNKAFKKGGSGPDLLTRFPTKYNTFEASPKMQAFEDMFWTLLNSSEFVFNH